MPPRVQRRGPLPQHPPKLVPQLRKGRQVMMLQVILLQLLQPLQVHLHHLQHLTHQLPHKRRRLKLILEVG